MFILYFFIISIIGTILHFTYELSSNNRIVGIFSAVNESIWEHIKIALTPFFILSIIDYFIIGNNNNYFFSKMISLVLLIVLIPLIFYSYTKLTKKSILIIDILSFYFAIFISQYIGFAILNTNLNFACFKITSLIVIFAVFIFYLLATKYPPNIFLFKDASKRVFKLL